MIDLRGLGTEQLNTIWTYDSVADEVTVTFKNQTEDVTFGAIQIEGRRWRSFLQSMDEVGRFFFPVADNQAGREFHQSLFNRSLSKMTTTFRADEFQLVVNGGDFVSGEGQYTGLQLDGGDFLSGEGQYTGLLVDGGGFL